ncbi:DUF6130 family protein [Paraburkholderia kirstenboschensis]|uniref:DUF6130 family protein n=1 Tax=Paraburkholderia kirstenboschensis TaxID=1245436 RepID=A0ABZ0EB93_9BURK|nr:DUF6130 family protein [Paraburkholderia kirstenboschensis]WOD14500.1 DUF6130 family protein [Paraburkholderia kirstenboschensis]
MWKLKTNRRPSFSSIRRCRTVWRLVWCGVVWIQYRVENLRIVPVFGTGATKVSPRVGHLHITVDNLPWWWADASDNNTIDIAGLPAGEHTVRIELVNPNHMIYETKYVKFNLPVTVRHEFDGKEHGH